jgi:hypothetical protein
LPFGLLLLVSPCEECYLGIRRWRNSVDELVTEQYLLLQELNKKANLKGGLKKRQTAPKHSFGVTLSYLSKIKGYLYPQRVSPP